MVRYINTSDVDGGFLDREVDGHVFDDERAIRRVTRRATRTPPPVPPAKEIVGGIELNKEED